MLRWISAVPAPMRVNGFDEVSDRTDGRVLNLGARKTQQNSFYFITSWPFPII